MYPYTSLYKLIIHICTVLLLLQFCSTIPTAAV